jgi:hypothetical protein
MFTNISSGDWAKVFVLKVEVKIAKNREKPADSKPKLSFIFKVSLRLRIDKNNTQECDIQFTRREEFLQEARRKGFKDQRHKEKQTRISRMTQNQDSGSTDI